MSVQRDPDAGGSLRFFVFINIINVIIGLSVQRDPDAGGEVVQGRGDGGPHQRQHTAPGGHTDPPHRGRRGGEGRGNVQVRDEGVISRTRGGRDEGDIQVRGEGLIYRTRGGRGRGNI